jgi:hypothetical protein
MTAWVKPFSNLRDWSPSAPSGADWVKPFPPDDLWRQNTSRYIRLTEDGIVRITEDGLRFRVIEHTLTIWTKPFPPPDPWVPA